MLKYKLDCIEWNPKHTKFNVFDLTRANCGLLIIETIDVFNFIKNNWNGDIFWNGKIPEDFPSRER